MHTTQTTALARRTIQVLALAAALLGADAALASGRAQVGVSLGIWSNWDLDPLSTATGTGWRDGTLVQTVDATSDLPRGSIDVYDGQASAAAELSVRSALLQSGGAPALPVAGLRRVESNLGTGTLRLRSVSEYVASPAPYASRIAYAQGQAYAEIIQSFDVRWALDHVGPVQVSLAMTIDGTVLANDGRDGWIAGLGVYLDLGNVVTGRPPLTVPFQPLVRFEGSVANEKVEIGGGFLNSQCSAALGYCESWVNVYAAIDLRSRNLADGSLDSVKGAAHDFDFGHTAQIALTSSPGVAVLRVDNLGQELPALAWVNPATAPVPEPASALTLAVGLGLVGWRVRRAGLSRPG